MDKQKQIEEMTAIIVGLASFSAYEKAEFLVNAGYCKNPENVVITREEYKKLKHGSGTLEQLYNQYPYRVLVGFNSMVFSQDRESYEKLYDEIEEKASKETAEKFAEKAKAKAIKARVNIDDHPRNDSFIFLSDIDEIAKEFTEGNGND